MRGSLWFTEYRTGHLARADIRGQVVELGLTLTSPLGITVGPGGRSLWVTSYDGNVIDRLSA